MNDITHYVQTLLTHMGIVPIDVVNETRGEQTFISVTLSDPAPFLSHNAEGLKSLNTIVRMMVEKKGIESRCTVDVNNFHKDHATQLEGMARMLAERARSLKYDVEMTPMRAFERMIVHAALTNEKGIKTESTGEGRERRVVIKYIGE